MIWLDLDQKKNNSFTMRDSLFHSKISLFGEYGVIIGSKGLIIPYNFYGGKLKLSLSNKDNNLSNNTLTAFSKYLKKIPNPLVDFNWKAMESDLDNYLYFESDIPKGYGVGSSGALVASIYDRYATQKLELLQGRNKLNHLKNIFSQMEDFFHGKSSGLDPLNSYLNSPILINSKNLVEMISLPLKKEFKNGAIFIMDTGKIKDTQKMVSSFMDRIKKKSFRNIINNEFIHFSEICIDNFLYGDFKSLIENTRNLSSIVFDNFKPMIPIEIRELWKRGIENNSYYLKLCGSGGGGFVLGFTKNINKARKELIDYQLKIVYNI